MIISSKIKIKKIKLSTLFIVICIVLNSAYCYVLYDDKLTILSLFLLSCVMIPYYLFLKKNIIQKRFWIHAFTILNVAIAITFMVKFDYKIWGSYIRQILILLLAVLIAQNIKFSIFKKNFINLMYIITLISIVVWILVNVFSITLPLPTFHSSWDKAYFTEYYNGIIFFVYSHQPYRLMGPFWEAGIYASFAIIALILNNEYSKINLIARKKIINCVLVIGIILSFSTAGYILLLILFVVRFLNKYKKISNLLFILIIVCVFLLFVFNNQIINYLAEVLPNVFGKLASDSSLSKSTRINGHLVDLLIFKNYPLFGAGIKGYQALWDINADALMVESRTSTITYFLANFGVLGALYGYTIVKGVIQQKGISYKSKIFLMIIIIFIVSKEPHYFNLLSCILISYFYYDKTAIIT